MDRIRTRQPISTGSEKIVVKSGGTRKEFEMDKVFPQEVSQGECKIKSSASHVSLFISHSNCNKKLFYLGNTLEDVFVEVEPILRSALDGHNVCVFAYGQTGTGKTFTMVSNKTIDCSYCCCFNWWQMQIIQL